MPKMMTSKATSTRRLAENYLQDRYARILIPDEGGGFTAEILEFPGCFAHGNTPDEAFANLEKTAADWIDAALAQGQEIPKPTTSGGFSGRVVLRLPRGLHERAAKIAERNRTSLNTYFLTAIAMAVGAEDMYHRIAHHLAFPQTLTYNVVYAILPANSWVMPSALSPASTISVSGSTMLVPSGAE